MKKKKTHSDLEDVLATTVIVTVVLINSRVSKEWDREGHVKFVHVLGIENLIRIDHSLKHFSVAFFV